MKREDVIYTLACLQVKSYKQLRSMSDDQLQSCINFVESQIGKKLKIKKEA